MDEFIQRDQLERGPEKKIASFKEHKVDKENKITVVQN